MLSTIKCEERVEHFSFVHMMVAIALQRLKILRSFMVRASYTYFSCTFGGVLCKRNNDTAKCAGTYPQFDEVIVLLISDASEEVSFCKESSCGARFCFIKYFTRKKVIKT